MPVLHDKWFLFASSAVLALVPPMNKAAAQTTEAAPEMTSEEPEELVITARKRAEVVQDVPDSIAVLTGAMIERAGIDNLDEAAEVIPNLAIVDSQDAGNVAISIRGIGQSRNGDAPVAINVDGVQLVSTDAIKQALFDLQRIEVLKGPQGALYGRNAIGGAINIITRAPTNKTEGRFKIEYANGDDWRLNGSLSGPIIDDKLLFRLSADYQNFDGVIENVTLNRDVDYREDVNVRGRLLFTPASNVTLDLRAGIGRLDGGASWYIPLPDDQPNNTSVPVQANELGTTERDMNDASAKVDINIGDIVFTSITAWSDIDLDFFQDFDWTPRSDLAAAQSRDVESFQQEFRFTSPSDRPLRWVVGASYLDFQRRIDTDLFFGEYLNFTPYQKVTVARTTEDGRSLSGYGQLNWDIAPALELTLGLRYDHERRKQHDRLTPSADRRISFDEWQPKISLAYDFTDEAMAYVTIARGYRSGGFNPPSASIPSTYKPETTTNYEIGAKTSWFDDALIVNASAFLTQYADQQVYLLKLGNQGIINIDETKILGFELETQVRPTERLQLSASLGLLDTEIENFDGSALYRGNKVPLAYGWSYTLSGQYSVPFENWTLVSRLEYTARGDNYWHIDNEDKQKSVHLVDARISAEFDNITLSAFAENLFNKKYTEEFFGEQFSALFSDLRYPGTPRRYGVSASFKF